MKSASTEFGVLYIATGDAYIEEAVFSASILKNKMPVPVCLVTDQSIRHSVFDYVVTLDNSEDVWRYKIEGMQYSPFEKTVFLDTDCYTCEDFSDLFDALRQYDIAMVWGGSLAHLHHDMPDYLFGFSTGMIAYQANEVCDELFRNWLRLYDKYSADPKADKQLLNGDQPTFSEALQFSTARILTLPYNYNFHGLKKGIIYQPVKILHLRPTFQEEFQALEIMINETPGWPKIFVGWDMIVRYKRDDYIIAGNTLNAVLGKPSPRVIRLKGIMRHAVRGIFRRVGRSLVSLKVKVQRR